MQANSVLWQQGHGPFQQTPLDPIHERNAATPEIPPRNPSRLSVSWSNASTARKNSREILPSITSRYSTSTVDDGLLAGSDDSPSIAPYNEDSPSPLDFVSALADMSMNQIAFASVGTELPHNRNILWGRQHQRSDSAQHEEGAHVDLKDKHLNTFRRGTVESDNNADVSENLEVSEKMQTLMFAQDYHNALTQRSSTGHDTSQESPIHHPNLTPQPLTWKKDPGCTPPPDTTQRPRLPPTSSSGRHKNLRMMSSWVNQRLNGFNQRSLSDPGSTPQLTISENEAHRYLKNEARLTNIVQHSKEFVTRKILRRETEPTQRLLISHPISQPSAQGTIIPSATTTPFEVARPVLRLPGGLTLVRQTPSSNQLRPQTATDPPISPSSDPSWPDFAVSSPFRRNFSRRGSVQSTHSQPAASPARPSHYAMYSPLASPTTMHSFSLSFSRSTPSLSTPVPQDSPSPLSPFSPPPPRRRSHNIGSPLSAAPSSHGMHEALEGVGHKLNLFEKARYAHGSWKRHQKEVRTERMKQSIRVVGPADARDVAGYIKCAVDGRVSGDSGIGEENLMGRNMV